MKIGLAVEALPALAQESGLSIFRLLVQAGTEGVAAGAWAKNWPSRQLYCRFT